MWIAQVIHILERNSPPKLTSVVYIAHAYQHRYCYNLRAFSLHYLSFCLQGQFLRSRVTRSAQGRFRYTVGIWRCLSNPSFIRAEMKTAPALSSVEYEEHDFENYFAHTSKYRGPPTAELEEEWKKLWQCIPPACVFPFILTLKLISNQMATSTSQRETLFI